MPWSRKRQAQPIRSQWAKLDCQGSSFQVVHVLAAPEVYSRDVLETLKLW